VWRYNRIFKIIRYDTTLSKTFEAGAYVGFSSVLSLFSLVKTLLPFLIRFAKIYRSWYPLHRRDQFITILYCTIILGLIFVFYQIVEFKGMFFSLPDGIFASLFYFITTTHGVHVVVGLIFLGISLLLYTLYAFDGTSSRPLMLECSAVY